MINKPLRLLIIEDEIVIGRHIQQILNAAFEVDTKLAITSEKALALMPQFLPHLVLCDINLNEEKNGIHLIQELQQRFRFETVFITSYPTKNMVEQARFVRPANYIIKPFDEQQLVASLEMLLARLQEDPSVGRAILNVRDLVSKMEFEVLKLIADKKNTKEIGEILFISPHTVKSHRHNIVRKLNLSTDNNALTLWAIENKGELV
jgi:DNA-binding NarL/FixJ family response regulator